MYIIEKLCENITHHKFRHLTGYCSNENYNEYYYKCLICGKAFWNSNPPVKLKDCTCGGKPELQQVGNNKEYLVYRCSKCHNTPAKLNEARVIVSGAARVWNRRIDD